MYPSFLFLRHAESLHNERSIALRKKYPNEKNLGDHPQYKSFGYLEELLDSPINEKGQNQCLQCKQKIKFDQIDTVLVSPLRRALQTCDLLFSDQPNIRIIVEPLLNEVMASACDIPASLSDSREQYKQKMDFSKIPEINQEEWYLNEILGEETRNKIYDELQKYQQNGGTDQKKVHHLALAEMKSSGTLESNHDVKRRASKLKKQLGYYKRLGKKKIAIVGHGGIFRRLTATSYTESGQPINFIDFGNTEFKEVPIIIDGESFEEDNSIPFCQI